MLMGASVDHKNGAPFDEGRHFVSSLCSERST